MPDAPIEVVREPGTRYASRLHRADGVVVLLRGTGHEAVDDRPERLPHDLAHLVVEDALALEHGLWGTLAAGGMFGHAAVVAGRRPPHADRRAREVVARSGDRLNQAEIVVAAVVRLTREGRDGDLDALRAGTGESWWPVGVDGDALRAACVGLRDAAARWRATPVGGELAAAWRHGDGPAWARGSAGGGRRPPRTARRRSR